MDDPRNNSHFKPELYPRCHDGPAPEPNAPEPAARRKLALLTAYYQINLCAQTLQTARQAPQRSKEVEHAALKALEKALLARDALEDQYAPYGIVSSPKVEGGLVTEVSFTSTRPSGPQLSSISMYYAMDVPVDG